MQVPRLGLPCLFGTIDSPPGADEPLDMGGCTGQGDIQQ